MHKYTQKHDFRTFQNFRFLAFSPIYGAGASQGLGIDFYT